METSTALHEGRRQEATPRRPRSVLGRGPMLTLPLLIAACVIGDGQVGEQGVVMTGVGRDGLQALTAELDDGGNLCLFLGGGGSCYDGVPNANPSKDEYFGVGGEDEFGGYEYIFGAIPKSTEAVTVGFSDGKRVLAEIGEGQGWDVNFYIACNDELLDAAPVSVERS